LDGPAEWASGDEPRLWAGLDAGGLRVESKAAVQTFFLRRHGGSGGGIERAHGGAVSRRANRRLPQSAVPSARGGGGGGLGGGVRALAAGYHLGGVEHAQAGAVHGAVFAE